MIPIRAQEGVSEKPWLSEVESHLSSFASLTTGWNGYSAPPPGPLAIQMARDFLMGLDSGPSRLAPSAVGGVGATFRAGSRKAYVEFYNDGRICVLFSDGSGEPLVRPVRHDLKAFATLASEIHDYLNA